MESTRESELVRVCLVRLFVYVLRESETMCYVRGNMIKSFNDKATEELFILERSRRYPQEILKRALRKLFLIDAAIALDDLKAPKGNQLKALKGDRIGQHSIRINRGWRICFEWRGDGVYDVEINNHYE